MSVRTVRLDDDAEKVLFEIQQETGLTISDAIKQGLKLLERGLPKRKQSPYEIYQSLDLGLGNASAPKARNAREEIAKLLQQKHRRVS